MRIAVVVGNGLSIDFVSRAGSRDGRRWHPSRPTKWRIINEKDPTIRYLDSGNFPVRAAGVRQVRAKDPSLSDFEVFVQLLADRDRVARERNSPAAIADLETLYRQTTWYLAKSYAHWQVALDPYIPAYWPWVKWLRQYRRQLRFFVSFNYDLMLERALSLALVPFARIGIEDESGAPILKPHGSIDFITSLVPNVPGNRVFDTDGPQRRLEKDELLGYRCEVNVVMPGHYSHMTRNQLVARGYAAFTRIAPTLTHCIFLGLSYWDVDRPEIDHIINALPANINAVIVNPRPPPDLVRTLESRNIQPVIWRDGPQAL